MTSCISITYRPYLGFAVFFLIIPRQFINTWRFILFLGNGMIITFTMSSSQNAIHVMSRTLTRDRWVKIDAFIQQHEQKNIELYLMNMKMTGWQGAVHVDDPELKSLVLSWWSWLIFVCCWWSIWKKLCKLATAEVTSDIKESWGNRNHYIMMNSMSTWLNNNAHPMLLWQVSTASCPFNIIQMGG